MSNSRGEIDSESRVRVSVLVPAYRGEHLLSVALDSLLDQAGVSFDVWISDDASTERSGSLIKEYDRRCHIFYQSSRLGLVGNHNFLLSCATGDYVTFLHQDDVLLPGSLRKRVEVLDSNPFVQWVSCDVEHIDRQGQSLGIQRTLKIPEPSTLSDMNARQREEEQWWAYSRFLNGNLVFFPSVMFRRSFVQAIGPFNLDLTYTFDLEYWLRCLLRSPLGHIPIPLLQYRVHSEQQTAVYQRDETRRNREILAALESAYRESARAGIHVPSSVQLLGWSLRTFRRVATKLSIERLLIKRLMDPANRTLHEMLR